MDLCLDSKLEHFKKDVDEYNAIVSHEPVREVEKSHLPFIGKVDSIRFGQ